MTSRRKHALWWSLATAVLAAAVAVPASAAPAAPAAVPSSHYEQTGPFPVSRVAGTQHTAYYPTNLGTGGMQHPVLI